MDSSKCSQIPAEFWPTSDVYNSMDIKDIMVCLDVMAGMDLLYCMALWSLWTQARRTTYELSVCENMYTSIRKPSACVSM